MASSTSKPFDYDSELPYPALHEKAKYVVLTDWVSSILL
jgi:hypothetical protein